MSTDLLHNDWGTGPQEARIEPVQEGGGGVSAGTSSLLGRMGPPPATANNNFTVFGAANPEPKNDLLDMGDMGNALGDEAAAAAPAAAPAQAAQAPPAPPASVMGAGTGLIEANAERGPASNILATTHTVKVTLADQQADPNSPLYSIKSFEELNLHPSLLKGLYNMKFKKPSKIQEKALPLLLSDPPTNMIAQSQSGTGKTAAFSLTMLSRMDYENMTPQAICLAPSRELARQIEQVILQMGEFVPVKTFLAVKEGWSRDTKVQAQIVIGTPGTVMDMLGRRMFPGNEIKVFVLDEADEMISEQGLGEQSMRVKKMIAKEAQVLLFSATFPEAVETFSKEFAPGANEIRLKTEELSVEGIKQFYMDCRDEDAKYDVLVELYGLLTIGQSIIFCRRRDTAERIAVKMKEEGHSVDSLHSDKLTTNRDGVIDKFRKGETKVLITTNVVARGIDISQVNMVINYDIPTFISGNVDTESYLHRVGRTGRFGKRGVAIMFVHDQKSWGEMDAIQRELQTPIIRISTGDYDEMEKALKAEMQK